MLAIFKQAPISTRIPEASGLHSIRVTNLLS